MVLLEQDISHPLDIKTTLTYQVFTNSRQVVHGRNTMLLEMACVTDAAVLGYLVSAKQCIIAKADLSMRICGDPKGPAQRITSFFARILLVLPAFDAIVTPVTASSPLGERSVSTR